MTTARLLSTLFFAMILVACNPSVEKAKISGKDPGETPSPGPQGKPLPASCEQELMVRLKWSPRNDAYGYSVAIGMAADTFDETFAIPPDRKDFLFTLPRGETYFIRATRYLGDGSKVTSHDMQLKAPTCAERAEYKAKNPKYSEPFDELIRWAAK